MKKILDVIFNEMAIRWIERMEDGNGDGEDENDRSYTSQKMGGMSGETNFRGIIHAAALSSSLVWTWLTILKMLEIVKDKKFNLRTQVKYDELRGRIWRVKESERAR